MYFSQQSLSIAALPVEKMLQNCNLQEGTYLNGIFIVLVFSASVWIADREGLLIGITYQEKFDFKSWYFVLYLFYGRHCTYLMYTLKNAVKKSTIYFCTYTLCNRQWNGICKMLFLQKALFPIFLPWRYTLPSCGERLHTYTHLGKSHFEDFY